MYSEHRQDFVDLQCQTMTCILLVLKLTKWCIKQTVLSYEHSSLLDNFVHRMHNLYKACDLDCDTV